MGDYFNLANSDTVVLRAALLPHSSKVKGVRATSGSLLVQFTCSPCVSSAACMLSLCFYAGLLWVLHFLPIVQKNAVR